MILIGKGLIMILKHIPKCLDGRANKSDIIFDFGTLSKYKKYMLEHRDFTDCSSLESMKNSGWSGVQTYGGFIELLDNGDDKVMEQIRVETKKSVAELTKKYKEVIRNYKFDVAGEFFDVGLVMTGVPESWLEPEPEQEEIQQVELLINGSFPDGSDIKRVSKNAGRILAMVKILEDHGVEVKIKQVATAKNFRSGKRNETMFMMVDIKDFDEPINYKKCSALMSPTFLRRGGMKMMEVVGGYDLRGNYGTSEDVKGSIRLLNSHEVDDLEKRLFGGKKQ